jgi:hypothetical protein
MFFIVVGLLTEKFSGESIPSQVGKRMRVLERKRKRKRIKKKKKRWRTCVKGIAGKTYIFGEEPGLVVFCP